MPKKARDDLLAKIGSREVVCAFDLLVKGMAEFGKFDLRPHILGPKKALHFGSGKVSYFAFTANRDWLLWYFRRPGLHNGVFTFEELKTAFPELEFSRSSDFEKLEAIVRVRTQEDAEAVLSFVGGKVEIL